ncbi:MAG: DUF4105 domain-containing protein [Oligoflexia bacterium]|nr:DUF4105 domain-containing protein [Oligoflexia bacterium]
MNGAKYFPMLFVLAWLGLITLNTSACANTPILEEWRQLLHFPHNANTSSVLGDETFFLAPDGHHNPESELQTNLAYLRGEAGPEKQLKLRCNFPLRVRFLQHHYAHTIPTLPHVICPEYERFKQNIPTKKVAIVFSSYFMESPASAFGHTFLRLSNSSSSSSSELLDVGVSFGAIVTTENPFLYAYYGLTGGFQANFTTLPYFYKVREYNDFESRDLWSYELSLSEAEIATLRDHLFELRFSSFRYYYLSKNCSYYLLELLELARPSLRSKLLSRLPFYTIPIDTIKILSPLVSKLSFRPSARTRLQQQKLPSSFLSLSDSTKAQVPNDAATIDALVTFLDYKYAREILNESGAHYEWRKQLLLKRSELPSPAPSPLHQAAAAAFAAPHLAHPPRRAGIAYAAAAADSEHPWHFYYRFAFHDLLDPPSGVPPYSSLELLSLHLQLSKKAAPSLHEITLLEASILRPFESYEHPLSYHLQLNSKRSSLGLGMALKIEYSYSEILLFPMIDLTLTTHQHQQVILALGPTLNLRLRASSYLSLLASYHRPYHLQHHPTPPAPLLTLEARLHLPHALSLFALYSSSYSSSHSPPLLLGLHHYF